MKRNLDGSVQSDERNPANRHKTVSTDPNNPPVEGAKILIVQNGDNAGLRYWGLYAKDQYGNSKNVYFQWIDNPVDDLRKRQDADIAYLKEKLRSIEEMVNEMEEVVNEVKEMVILIHNC